MHALPFRLPVLLLAFFGLVGLAPAPADAEPPDWVDAVRSIVRPGDVLDSERTPLDGGFVHDRLRLRVGDGPYDQIDVHRVMRAGRGSVAGTPVMPPVMLVHGGRWGFEPIFLDAGPQSPSPSTSFALFLADAGFDVWGLDARWIDAPAEVDPSLYADWDLASELADLDRAFAVAEAARRGSPVGGPPVGWSLVGYSQGGPLVLARAATVTSIPAVPRRRVQNLVLVDSLAVTDDPGLRQEACDRLDVVRARRAAGATFEDLRFFNQLGALALVAPDAPSPLAPQLTNRQIVLLLGLEADPARAVVPGFHRVAGDVTFPPLETSLRYTDESRWLDLFARGAEIAPLGPEVAFASALCDRPGEPASWAEDLGAITIPVLYLGAGGGIGEYGLDLLPRLGSRDITAVLVDDEPDPADRGIDRGHLDLVLSRDAASRTWAPIRDWIDARVSRPGR